MTGFIPNKPEFSIRHSTVFAIVAELGSQLEAAKRLCISPAGVSRSIATLEVSLGLQLVNREKVARKLTVAGVDFLYYAKSIFEYQKELLKLGCIAALDDDRLSAKAFRIEISIISDFIRVAECGAFSAAAVRSEKSQSNISRNVKNLEDLVGVTLLSRKSSGVALTTAGSAALTVCRNLLGTFSRAVAVMSLGEHQSESSVVISGSIALVPKLIRPALTAFKRDFPQCRLDVRAELSYEVEKAVRTGDAIVGICGVVEEKSIFIYKHLLEVQLGVITTESMALKHPISSLEDLKKVPLLRFGEQSLITEVLQISGKMFPDYANSPLIVSSVEAGFDLVRGGDFAMLITGIGACSPAAQGLIFTPLPGVLPTLKVGIIQARGHAFDERQQRVVEALCEGISSMPWHESIRILK